MSGGSVLLFRVRGLQLALLCGLVAIAVNMGGGSRWSTAQAAGCTKSANPSNAQATINGAQAGDVVCLAAGVYAGPVGVYGKSGITVRGQGMSTIVVGGTQSAVLVINSSNITIEAMKLFLGNGDNAYVGSSQNVVIQNIEAGGGMRGVQFNENSTGELRDSYVYAMQHEGIVVQQGSGPTISRNWIFNNGGVGIAIVHNTGTTNIVHNIISDNRSVGVFAGEPGCADLPPADVAAPQCFLNDPARFIASGTVNLDENVIQANSPGVVIFPGIRGEFHHNHFWRNSYTGLFVWGSAITSFFDEFSGNSEHSVEYRAYPDPSHLVGTQWYRRANGGVILADIHDTQPLPGTNDLGGGVLAQASDLNVAYSRIYHNFGIGVSYGNSSFGLVASNSIFENRGSALCLFNGSNVIQGGNALFRNFDDRVGACEWP